MEAEVGDAVKRILGRIDGDVAFGCVEDVGDSDLLQVLNVLDGLAVAQNDPGVYLIERNTKMCRITAEAVSNY